MMITIRKESYMFVRGDLVRVAVQGIHASVWNIKEAFTVAIGDLYKKGMGEARAIFNVEHNTLMLVVSDELSPQDYDQSLSSHDPAVEVMVPNGMRGWIDARHLERVQ